MIFLSNPHVFTITEYYKIAQAKLRIRRFMVQLHMGAPLSIKHLRKIQIFEKSVLGHFLDVFQVLTNKAG